MTDQGFPVGEIDTSRPHPARMYDFYLGGRDNYEVDREAAQRVIDLFPDIVPTTRANRQFMHRTVRHLARSGIRQIIDIGTGIPTAPNAHQVAQEIAPDVRVAYVDNDPIVATHAGAQLLGNGNTGFFLGDLRDPDSILGHPTLGKLIDFEQPVGLLMVAVVHFLPDDAEAAALIAAYRDALPAGSLFVLSHATEDFHHEEAGMGEAREVYRDRRATATVTTRSYERILPFFDGYDLIDPGLVQIPLWHPDGRLPTAEELSHVGTYGGIGAKL